MMLPWYNWGRETVQPTVTTVVGGGSHPPDRKHSEGLVFFTFRPDNPLIGPILHLIYMRAHSTNQGPLGSIYTSRWTPETQPHQRTPLKRKNIFET